MGSSVNVNVQLKEQVVIKNNEEKAVSPKMDSIEDVFQQIQDDYVRIAGSEYNNKNYKEHMKVNYKSYTYTYEHTHTYKHLK